ncbi:hypothetical protein ACJW30_10G051200 [Castanea mollissima]
MKNPPSPQQQHKKSNKPPLQQQKKKKKKSKKNPPRQIHDNNTPTTANSHQNPPEIKPITTVRHQKSNPKPTQNSHTTARHTMPVSPRHDHADLQPSSSGMLKRRS